MQEREQTTRLVATVDHNNDDHFIVNMHSLHRPHVLRSIFGYNSHSIPSIVDRTATHIELASTIRSKAAEKDKQAAEKRRAKNSEAGPSVAKKTKSSIEHSNAFVGGELHIQAIGEYSIIHTLREEADTYFIRIHRSPSQRCTSTCERT